MLGLYKYSIVYILYLILFSRQSTSAQRVFEYRHNDTIEQWYRQEREKLKIDFAQQGTFIDDSYAACLSSGNTGTVGCIDCKDALRKKCENDKEMMLNRLNNNYSNNIAALKSEYDKRYARFEEGKNSAGQSEQLTLATKRQAQLQKDIDFFEQGRTTTLIPKETLPKYRYYFMTTTLLVNNSSAPKGYLSYQVYSRPLRCEWDRTSFENEELSFLKAVKNYDNRFEKVVLPQIQTGSTESVTTLIAVPGYEAFASIDDAYAGIKYMQSQSAQIYGELEEDKPEIIFVNVLFD